MAQRKKPARPRLTMAATLLGRHFKVSDPSKLVTTAREYPIPARVDLQRALDEMMGEFGSSRMSGLHAEYVHDTVTVGHLLGNRHAVVVGPLQYEQVDIGEVLPAPCVVRALWLAKDGLLPFALLLGPATRYGQPTGTNVELVVPPGEAGLELARQIFERLDNRVKTATAYRGRVISLGQADRYSGAMGVIHVHKLRPVEASQLVLPAQTLALLNRNVIGFVEQRAKLRALGLSAKKGLLFYGPPGTGKTHTLHYLASRLPGHTMLLITAEEVGLLQHYFQLARFLQPSILVIEDADLIARARESMGGACEELLLNKLLNEMDGLREDAEILFILTTNRPEQIEGALAARPGRIDQAIEFPLPDDHGRRLLTRLYGAGLEMNAEVVEKIVQRTHGASAALIKELMRRSAQFLLESGQTKLTVAHAEAALGEMLFDGGTLNAKLLGGVSVARA